LSDYATLFFSPSKIKNEGDYINAMHVSFASLTNKVKTLKHFPLKDATCYYSASEKGQERNGGKKVGQASS
jgi:hypothetical protein